MASNLTANETPLRRVAGSTPVPAAFLEHPEGIPISPEEKARWMAFWERILDLRMLLEDSFPIDRELLK